MMVLNKYLAHAGICSRRKAADLIKQGVVQVDGVVVVDPSHRVGEASKVVVRDAATSVQEKIYILLNKPNDFVTTVSDEKGRRTVMDLVKDVGPERLYPVGRLDRSTTGLLIMTNDGTLAQKLSHPSNEIQKTYRVTTHEIIAEHVLERLCEGVPLEDGVMKVDSVERVQGGYGRSVDIVIHSGKNRIIRRLFEALGHLVVDLDRIGYASLRKHHLSVGKWRFLSSYEIERLLKPSLV